jgi:tetratricopeptide (TPR) repeat protein
LATVLAAKERTCNDLEVRAALLVELADLHEHELDNVDQAIAYHQSVLGIRPNHAGAFRCLLRLLRKQQRFAELVELHERAVESAPDDAEAISHLTEAALIHDDILNDPAAALGVFLRILERDQNNLTALRGAQRLAETGGDGRMAVEMIERETRVVEGTQRKVSLMLRAAEVSERQVRDENKALAILEEVLSLDPDNRAALSAVARIHRRADRHTELCEALLKEAKKLEKPTDRARLQQSPDLRNE